jgi:molybdopterin/thiamine biosynthesis adenylyltransferase
MKYSAAFTSDIHTQLIFHLIRKDRQEDLCFALWYPSQGSERLTALLQEVVLPEVGDHNVHGNASFNPEYFERVLGFALQKKAGIAFLHSHLGPGWQGMSNDDFFAEKKMAGSIKAATGLPLIGLTVGTDGSWSARVWEKKENGNFDPFSCENVRVIGENGLDVTFDDYLLLPPQPQEELKRTISSWGLKSQQKLARLKIGVVGLGSVGAIVAEGLARMGIEQITLIDFDRIEKHNIDRHLHASAHDAKNQIPKVSLTADKLKKGATAKNFSVKESMFSVSEEEGFREAINCDILFSCADKPLARYILNYISHAYLIPVIDGGIAIKVKKNNELQHAHWKAHTILPASRCLECLDQYDPAHVQLERDGFLDDPKYIDGLDDEHVLKSNQNVFPFSLNLASLEIMQMLSLVIKPSGISDVGEQNYSFVSGTMDVEYGTKCNKNCMFQSIIGLGDSANWPITSKNIVAEKMREDQAKKHELTQIRALDKTFFSKNLLRSKMKKLILAIYDKIN